MTIQSNTPPKRADASGPSTRQRIIDAARAEFAESGYPGARVDQIASRAGVNKAMIYYHFNSKKNLYLEVIRAFYLDARAFLQQETASSETTEQLLASLADVYANLFGRIEEIRPIVLRELANPSAEVTAHIAQILGGSGIPQKVLGSLQEGANQGRLRPIDSRQALISFVTMNVGYFFLAPLVDRILNISDRETFIEERKKAVVDIFLNGIKVK
jgi:AcrR family transcriptional regulator